MDREVDLSRSLEAARLRVVSGLGTSAPKPADNLPLQLTSFVGREREMAEVEGLVEGARLVALTGPGGCGKTRMALEVAGNLVECFEDGVWLVELASLSDPALVPRAIASVLDVREQPGKSLAHTLSEYLQPRKILLVLDNCEHLVEVCAELLGTLLRAAPNLRVLATSRESLGVDGEVKWRVSPLATPDKPVEIEALARYEAVRLFVERARLALPSFALTEENGRAAAEICRKVEGLPLCIELAAARVGRLSIAEISARLDGSLALLSGGGRTAPPRHRTLQATLDWSHELLGDSERALFRRLSVFSGGFSLEAIGEEDVDTLLALIEKSLVKVEEGDAPRYRLLEPVRRYARGLLEESGDVDRVQGWHAGYYLALAEKAEPELAGPGQARWLDLLGAEHDNFRAALSWFLAEGDVEKNLRLSAALGARFWNMRSPGEGRGWLERGLSGGAEFPASLRAKALGELGFLAMCQGDFRRTTEALEEGLALSKELEDERGIAMSLGPLGFAASQYKDREWLSNLHRETETRYGRTNDPWSRGYLAIALGFAAVEEGDLERATEFHEEALSLFRSLGDSRSIAMCLNALGLAALERGRYERARILFEEELRLMRELREKVGTHEGLSGMAAVFGAGGETVRAARLWGAAEALQEALGLPRLRDLPTRYDYEGRLSAARRLLDEKTWSSAWDEGRALTPEAAIEHALEEHPPQPTFPAGLTAREAEVLRLVAKGYTNAEAAEKLFISPRTVNWHLTSIYRKVGLGSRPAAIRFAVENGLA